MVFSPKQKQVTQNCAVSDDKDYWLIGSEGTRLRPSNWPERIASTFIQMEQFAKTKKLVSECVSTKVVDGRPCLRVRKKFQEGCGKGWNYVESFAKANNLSIVDNHGKSYTIKEKVPENCPELDHILEPKEA